MRAIEIREAGELGRLVPCDLPSPDPAPGEVAIDVAAAGVNHADLFQVAGQYPLPKGRAVPGLEVSGRIAALGEGVQGFAPGDAVCALLKSGGYAERVCVPAGQVLPVPAGMALRDAAALPEALTTVWLALFRLGRLQAGETVLIHGGASGIGVAAVQLARLAGAEVLATARLPQKQAFCRELGATIIDGTPEDFTLRVMEATEGRGVDIILDMVGGAYSPQHFEIAARYGRIITIALLAGKDASIPMGRLLVKNLSWHGMTLNSRPEAEKAALLAEMRSRVWPWIESGAYRIVIDRAFPLEDAQKAHQAMHERLHIGKILLEVGH